MLCKMLAYFRSLAESEVNEKWSKFAERPGESILAPLDKVYQTSFGGIR